jgi:hypothetical protein
VTRPLLQLSVPSIRAAMDEFLTALHPFRAVLTVEKGVCDLTEMYSALCAEVPLPADPRTGLNLRLLRHLKRASKVSPSVVRLG